MVTISDFDGTNSSCTAPRCNKYQEIAVIHQGRSNIVYLATAKRQTSTLPSNTTSAGRTTEYVIKKIALTGKFSDLMPRSCNFSVESRRGLLYCEREIEALQLLKSHPNIVELIDVTRTDSNIELIFMHCKTNLHSLIHDEGWFASSSSMEGVEFTKIKQCCRMILQGLGHCHSHFIIHRDMKPSNILMDYQGVIKLADFGQARTISCASNDPAPLTAQVGSRYYRAPELIFGSTIYNESIDMWSFGCILAEICTKKVLFPGNSDIEQLMLIVEALGEAPSPNFNGASMEDFNKIIIESARSREDSLKNLKQNVLMPLISRNDCVDLITKLCTYENRLNVEQALDHDFISH